MAVAAHPMADGFPLARPRVIPEHSLGARHAGFVQWRGHIRHLWSSLRKRLGQTLDVSLRCRLFLFYQQRWPRHLPAFVTCLTHARLSVNLNKSNARKQPLRISSFQASQMKSNTCCANSVVFIVPPSSANWKCRSAVTFAPNCSTWASTPTWDAPTYTPYVTDVYAIRVSSTAIFLFHNPSLPRGWC